MHAMPFALRPHFGDFAGGFEHAFALATLARAGDATDAAPLAFELRRPTNEIDLHARLVALLQDVVLHAGYTVDDLRREGFAEPVLSALSLTARAQHH
jgi:hypothetical protein